MALWPNARYMTRSTYKGYGVAPGLDSRLKGNGDRMNRFAGQFAKTAATPDGYGMGGLVPPVTAGSMSCLTAVAEFSAPACNLLQGGPMQGNGSVCSVSADGNLAMIVSMSGTATVASLTGNGVTLALTIGLSGNGTWQLTGSGGLSMIVPFSGTGSMSLNGIADLKGICSMSGEWTPFTELSPEGLASSLWGALATQFNEPGTMGAKLNTASSGGVDTTALADAVWQHADAQAIATRLAEAWGRLGLDPSKPLVTGQTSITFGDIVMAMTGDATETTVTRQ